LERSAQYGGIFARNSNRFSSKRTCNIRTYIPLTSQHGSETQEPPPCCISQQMQSQSQSQYDFTSISC
jgi:hypothetical protein